MDTSDNFSSAIYYEFNKNFARGKVLFDNPEEA